MLGNVTIRKAPLVVAALGGFLLLGGFATVQARTRAENCRTRVHKAEIRLDREIRDHGIDSRQARYRRQQLENAQRDCRQYLRGDRDRDHDRDWDHDRDRDRDHDRDHDRDRNHRRDRDHDHDHDHDHNIR